MAKISDISIISLDLETGGLTLGKHTPLSIGAVVLRQGDHSVTEENSFYTQLEWDTVVVDPKALRINKLDIANPPGDVNDIFRRSLPVADGLNLFREWLAKQSVEPIYALGMNVGSFDLPMLLSVWQGPWPFHYRSIDLNSLFFALSQIQNKPFDAVKQEITKIAWDNSIFHPSQSHHALIDAWSNIYVWEECLKRFNGDYNLAPDLPGGEE